MIKWRQIKEWILWILCLTWKPRNFMLLSYPFSFFKIASPQIFLLLHILSAQIFRYVSQFKIINLVRFCYSYITPILHPSQSYEVMKYIINYFNSESILTVSVPPFRFNNEQYYVYINLTILKIWTQSWFFTFVMYLLGLILFFFYKSSFTCFYSLISTF